MIEPDATVLALDIGGSQIRAAAILPDGACLGRLSTPTPATAAEDIYEAAAALLCDVRDGLDTAVRGRLAAIGISSMGPVDPWRGVVVDPPNVPALRDAPLADEMERRVGLPAYLERDTNVAALAELWRGAARGLRGLPLRDGLDRLGRGDLLRMGVPCWVRTERRANSATSR